MQNKLVFFIASLVLLNFSNAEQSLTKKDFAFGNEIEITDYKSVIGVPLNEDVYLNVKSSNLDDLTVFNAKGESVPHVIYTGPVYSTAVITYVDILKLFPYSTSDDDSAGFNQIEISTEDNGSIVKITNNNNKTDTKSVNGYLIDATKIENAISKFKFSHEDIVENLVIKLKLEGSQDLKNWSTIDDNVVLANFKVGEQQLLQDEVSLYSQKYKYYRMTSENADIKLTSVTAHSYSAEKTIPDVVWKNVKPKDLTNTENTNLYYNFDLEGFYPVYGIKLIFADQNSIANFSLEAANNESGPWKHVTAATFYKMKKNEAELSKEEVRFSENRFRFFRLKLNSSQAGIGSGVPEVYFGWRANTLRFLARGEGPFTLAYGRAERIIHSKLDILGLKSDLDIGVGSLKSKTTLGGVEKLTTAEESDFNYRKIALWSVLILAVAFLGRMAFQLNKQMPQD